VRAWGAYDAFIYNMYSSNPYVVWLYTTSLACFFPKGNLILATILSGITLYFMVAAYSMLVSIMPRAGGDYVWQSRVLGGIWGYVFCLTGWVIILFMWTPIFGQFLNWSAIVPTLVVLSYIFKNPALIDSAIWWNGRDGIFLSSIIQSIWWAIIIALGMKIYAKVQKWTFHIGLACLVPVIYVMATSSRAEFISAYNAFMASTFGISEAYSTAIKEAASLGLNKAWENLDVGASFTLLVPLLYFSMLYPNWGAPLYGEVRGASSMKVGLKSMAGANTFNIVVGSILLLLIFHLMGPEFYHSINYVAWMGGKSVPVFPFPSLLAASLVTRYPILMLIMQLTAWIWLIGWGPCVFLSSTRVLFAMAFDRVLPDWVGKVTTRFRAPINALIIMFVGSLIITWLYCYTIFWTFTLDAMVVILVTYVVTCLSGVLLPYLKPHIYKGSPCEKYKIGKLPLLSLISGIYFAIGIWAIYRYIVDSRYGVNHPISGLFMIGTYIFCAILYFIHKWYRKRQGIEVELIYKEIPAE